MKEPKFKIGQKVFYTTYTAYGYNWGNDSAYKTGSNRLMDNIVLYGTIRSIVIDGTEEYGEYFNYDITVEKYEGLERNNEAVEYRKDEEEYWNLTVQEENIFPLDELDKAKEKANIDNNIRIKEECEERERERLYQLEDNCFQLYIFLLREVSEFNIRYTEEELNALYKLMSSQRLRLDIWNTKFDLKDHVNFDAKYIESRMIYTDKQYVKLLRKCLKTNGFDE